MEAMNRVRGNATAFNRAMQGHHRTDQMIARGVVLRYMACGRRQLFEHVGEKSVVHMDMNGFSGLGCAGSLQDQCDAIRVESCFKARGAFERPAVELVRVFEGDFGLVRDRLRHGPVIQVV